MYKIMEKEKREELKKKKMNEINIMFYEAKFVKSKSIKIYTKRKNCLSKNT